MKYDDDPQQILFNNRTRIPNLAQLLEQVNMLARLALNCIEDSQRIDSLEGSVDLLKSNKQAINPIRALDTDFIIDPICDADVVYSVDLGLVVNILGLSTNEAKVSLMINGIEAGSVRHNLQATIVLGLSLTPTHRYILQGFVPAGSTVNLTTSLIGTGTATLVASAETIYTR